MKLISFYESAYRGLNHSHSFFPHLMNKLKNIDSPEFPSMLQEGI